jgi:hypothetical protein
MADNFNLSKFIRNNPLLNESIGGYRDIKPMKEEKESIWIKDQIKSIIDNAGINSGAEGTLMKMYNNGEFDKALEPFKQAGGGSQEARARTILIAYLQKLDGSKPMEEADYELEKPENIYADDENETYGRAFGLAGQQLKSAIDALRQADYNDEDIKNFLMTGIDMYDQAFDGYDDLEDAENINELEGSVDIKDVTFISKNGGEAYEEVQVVDEMPGMIKFKVLKAHPNSTRLGKDFTVSTGRFYSNYEQKGFGPKMTDPGYMNRD